MSVLHKRDYRIIRFLDTPVTDSGLNNTFEILTRNRFKDGVKGGKNVDQSTEPGVLEKSSASGPFTLRSQVFGVITIKFYLLNTNTTCVIIAPIPLHVIAIFVYGYHV